MTCSENRDFVCPEEGCSSTFKTLSHMNTHLLVHSNERPFVCPENECTMSFKRLSHVERHQIQCHGRGSSHRCPHDGCNKMFCSLTSLRRHEKRFHVDPKYKCSVCGKILFKKKQLQIHEAHHKDENPFKCTVEGCGKAFATPSRLTVHQKQHRGYECPVTSCSAIFYKWSLLLQHKRNEHRKEYPCTQCEKRFLSNFNLKKHQLIHSSTREVHHCPHEDCSRQYFDFKNLNTHLKRFHQEQSFECPHEGCGRKFVHKKSIASHIESHTKPKPKRTRTKKKVPYNFVKRRSAAAMLSGHQAEKEEEQRILTEDKELTLANVKQQLEDLQKSKNDVVFLNMDAQPVQQCLIMQNA